MTTTENEVGPNNNLSPNSRLHQYYHEISAHFCLDSLQGNHI